MSEVSSVQLESKTMPGLFALRRISDAGGVQRTVIVGIIPGDVRSEECIAGDWPLGADEFVIGALMWATVGGSATGDMAIGETHDSLLMRLGEFAANAFEGVTKGVGQGVVRDVT